MITIHFGNGYSSEVMSYRYCEIKGNFSKMQLRDVSQEVRIRNPAFE